MYFDNHKKEVRRYGETEKTIYALLTTVYADGSGMSEELTDWAAEKANDVLEVVGGGVQEAIDDLENAEY